MNITENRKKILNTIDQCMNSDDAYIPTAEEISSILNADRGNVRRTLYQLEKARLVERVELDSYYSTRFSENVHRKCVGWKIGGVSFEPVKKKELTDEERNYLLDKLFGVSK